MTAEIFHNIAAAGEREMKDHDLVAEHIRLTTTKGVRYEKRPVKGTDGKPVTGLYNALDHPRQSGAVQLLYH
jgi:hypothetical protein